MPTGPRAHWRWWGWLVAGLGCGALIGLSVPPFGWWPLAWLGFAGIAFLLPGQPIRTRILLGLGAGTGQFIMGLWWVQEFSIPGWIALIVVSGLYTMVAVAVVPTGRRSSVAIGLPVAMMAAEWARDRFPLGGFPLGEVALGQVASPLAPTLRLGGSLLLTGMAAFCGVILAAMAEAALRWRSTRSPWSSGLPVRAGARRITWAALGLVAIGLAVVGVAELSPSGAGSRLPPMKVALVQGGGPRGTRAINTDPELVVQRQLAASASLQAPLDLVIWPEGVLENSNDAASASALARRLHATLLSGAEQDVGTDRYLNEVVVWGPDGKIEGRYQKHHLVPFGEYVPGRSLLKHVFNLSDVPLDGIPGPGPGILQTTAGPLGVLVSYEVFFDHLARDAVRAGGQVLTVPTNTASYRSSQVPTQELAAARMRAWETGRWTLQVTPTGYTAVVGPKGQVAQRTRLDEQGVLLATVPRENGRTVYVALGDTPVVVGACLLLGLAWIQTRARRGKRHHDQWTFPLSRRRPDAGRSARPPAQVRRTVNPPSA
jgi:apolipoprotein N-acyltransferase